MNNNAEAKHNRILVVDDEQVMCSLLADILTEKGYAVDTAHDGKEGIQMENKTLYDLVITDIKMPGMDGISVIKEMKKIDPDLVSVIITGYGSLETAQEALRLGAYDYITKPFQIDSISFIVRRALETRQLLLANKRLMGFLRDQNVILDKKVKERTSQLELLYNIGKEISSTLEVDEILKNIVNRISDNLQLEICSILLLDEKTGELVIRAARGLDKEVIAQTRVKIGERISGWVVEQKEAVLVEDIEKDPRFMKRNLERYYTKSFISVPIQTKRGTLGVININNKKNKQLFTKEDFELIREIASEAGVAIDNAMLYKSLQDTYLKTVTALVSAIDAKDHYTRNHSESVSKYAVAIAEEMELPPEKVNTIKLAAQLHDIGKIGVHDQILTKASSLTAEEWEEVKQHSVKGAEILSPLGFLKDVAEIVKHNHERFDGKGYPDGLRGENIPLGARIMAIADAYDTMASTRPYREILPKDKIIEEIKRSSGSQFDPKVVKAFLQAVEKGKF